MSETVEQMRDRLLPGVLTYVKIEGLSEAGIASAALRFGILAARAERDAETAARALEDAADGLDADPASALWEMWDSVGRDFTTPVDWLRARAQAIREGKTE